MRLVRLVVLAAAALAAALAPGSARVASDTAVEPAAPELLLEYALDDGYLLRRVDPQTLEARSGALRLGGHSVSAVARSPDGRRLAAGTGDGVRLVWADVRTMRRLGTVAIAKYGFVAGLAWPSPGRIVVALGGAPRSRVAVVDAEAGRVLTSYRLSGVVLRAVLIPRGLALLLAPADDVGPAALVLATPAGLRAVPLPLEAGVDPPQVAEPGVAVSPDGRRAVIVPGGARVLEVDLRTLEVGKRVLAEPVALLGRLRAWLDPAAQAKGPFEGPVREAAWVGPHSIVVAGFDNRRIDDRMTVAEAAGVRLIDTRDWSVRTLAADAAWAAVAGETVLAFGGGYGPDGLRGAGVRAFSIDGRERFHLFDDRFVALVTPAGRSAYVTEHEEAATRTVIDLGSGAIMGTVRKSASVTLIPLLR